MTRSGGFQVALCRKTFQSRRILLILWSSWVARVFGGETRQSTRRDQVLWVVTRHRPSDWSVRVVAVRVWAGPAGWAGKQVLWTPPVLWITRYWHIFYTWFDIVKIDRPMFGRYFMTESSNRMLDFQLYALLSTYRGDPNFDWINKITHLICIEKIQTLCLN